MELSSYIPASPRQPCNPTDEQRHTLVKTALERNKRPEDFDYIYELLSPPKDITSIINPGALKGVRIGVIGAGLAGLSSAFELRKTGADITIFEAEEKRIGGRVYTHYFDDSRTLYGELGPMRIPSSHETVWHYINLFKLSTRPFIQSNENAFIFLNNTRVRNDSQGENVMDYIYPTYPLTAWEKKTPWQQLLYLGLEAPLLYANPPERSELLQVKPYYNSFVKYWDFQSNRRILKTAGLSQGAIDMLSSLSPLAGRNLYNSYVDIAQANYPVNLSYLYEIPGGTSRLPYAIYESLINPNPAADYPDIPVQYLGKINFRHGNWITGIHRDRSGKVLLAYNNKDEVEAKYESFDYVICAIPFSTLRTVDINPLFSNVKMQAIRELNYIASQKTLMLCSRRFWEEGGPEEQIIGGGSYTDLPISTIWYPSDHAEQCNVKYKCTIGSFPYNKLCFEEEKNKASAAEPGVLMASYNYSLDTTRLANLPDELRHKEIKQEVELVHGLPKGYLDGIALDFKTINWNSYAWARGALPYFTPQQKKLFSYGMSLPEYDNRVFMAGDHISAVHRWMQGALQSGMIAANQIAVQCRRRERYK